MKRLKRPLHLLFLFIEREDVLDTHSVDRFLLCLRLLKCCMVPRTLRELGQREDHNTAFLRRKHYDPDGGAIDMHV